MRMFWCVVLPAMFLVGVALKFATSVDRAPIESARMHSQPIPTTEVVQEEMHSGGVRRDPVTVPNGPTESAGDEIRVRVLSEEGGAIAGAGIRVAAGLLELIAASPLLIGETDDAGGLLLSRAAIGDSPRRISVLVEAPRHLPVFESLTWDVREIQVTLPLPRRVLVKVVNSAGMPLEGAQVSLGSGFGPEARSALEGAVARSEPDQDAIVQLLNPQGVTPASGEIELTVSPDRGYRLIVSALDHCSHRESLGVLLDPMTEVEVCLPRLLGAAVRFTDSLAREPQRSSAVFGRGTGPLARQFA